MMRGHSRRLGRVGEAISRSPVLPHVLDEAYDWFTSFGELPEEDDRLAYEVVQQALRGGEERAPATVDARGRTGPVEDVLLGDDAYPPSVRALLFGEALRASPSLRRLARAAITVEVAYGGDVESPAFGARYGIPMYGSMAMHMHGGDSLVRSPYEFQAQRLLVRLDNIRGQIPHSDPRWFEEQAKAALAFRQTGALPTDDLHLEAVLAGAEFDQLREHRREKDVSQAMALFNALQWKDGDEQVGALKQLCAMAAAGKLP